MIDFSNDTGLKDSFDLCNLSFLRCFTVDFTAKMINVNFYGRFTVINAISRQFMFHGCSSGSDTGQILPAMRIILHLASFYF